MEPMKRRTFCALTGIAGTSSLLPLAGGCGGTKAAEPEAAKAAAPAVQKNWPMYRGSPDFRGIAAGSLPDAPELLWQFDTGEPLKASPSIDNGKVVIGSDSGKIHAINLADGKEAWHFDTEEPIESTALILDGVVYIGSSDSFVYALDLETGKKKWAFETLGQVLGAPGYTRNDGKLVILAGSYDFFLYGIDAATGKKLWSYETENYINGGPALSNNWVVFGGCDENLHVVSAIDGKPVRKVPAGSYIAGSPALEGKRAYVGHYGSKVVCADLEKGEILWEFTDRDFPFFATPAVDDKHVVAPGRDKRVHCLNKATGEKIWSYKTRGSIDSSPVICGDKVVVGSDDGNLYLINLKDGTLAWSSVYAFG